jgi:DNA-directed RNA polymerase sigma subunit (sigma70/sigma32)
MALKRKTSLKPLDDDDNGEAMDQTPPKRPSSPAVRKSRRRSRPVVASLVQSDPILAELLNASVPVATPQKDEDPSTQAKVESALQGLGKLESEVIGALFPTDGGLPEPFESVAHRLGMTIEEVKGIADNALRGLRGTRGPANRISTVWN